MKYETMVKAIFIERPNRFIALCQVNEEIYKVHVKNTGRCAELLIKGVTVYLQESNDPKRKTKYSLIAVEKGNRLINMDSQAPNEVVEEALVSGKLQLPGMEEGLTFIKREVTYDESRFDFYVETYEKKGFIEVKGVTLEQDGYVMFPDAPTERGLRHVEELIKAKQEGYECYVVFVIQMKDVLYFKPHVERQKAFAEALKRADKLGVRLLAYDCLVTPDTLELDQSVQIQLEEV